ncbi:MAG: hypothetical protein PUE95_12300 [Lachnospiraceae bacterium]|nr:hypothetical protein [Lachnospiraceae bacterium]
MRNFEEEYKNYINEEVPNLWSRIEPQLQDKIVDDNKTDFDNEQHGNDVENTIDTATDNQKNTIDTITDCQEKVINEVTNQQKKTKKKIYSFAKRALPAVAAIFVLAIGIGVLQTSKYAKNESGMAVATDCAPAEATDEGFFAESTEEEPDESFAETEVLEEEFYEEAVEAESEEPVSEGIGEGVNEDNLYENTVQAGDGEIQNSMDIVKENESASKSDAGLSIPGQDIVAIKGAVLNGIEVADATMKEKGYVYIYRFTLADGNQIRVYLTEEQCRNIEETELVIERKRKYDLDIIPCSDQDKEDELADCILRDIKSAND